MAVSHHSNISLFTLQAYMGQGDAFLTLNKFDLAEQSYSASLDIDHSIRQSKSFKVALNL
jgi:trans-2-enoyl-CoA reductase